MSFSRVDSHMPLQDQVPISPTMPMTPHVVAHLHSRMPKQRTTFIALVALVFLTTYIFIAHSSSFPPTLRHADSPAADQLTMALETIQNSRLADMHRNKGHHHLVPLELDIRQELAAVTSFLASLPQNVIPHTVDPSRPIDPQLVLDFDTRSPRARQEVKAMMEDVWLRNPVFLYSKRYSPASREIKSILASLYLRPAPTIIDVDIRDDAEILTPMIQRLTSSSELPVLLVGGTPILKPMKELHEMEKNGELQKLITAAGSLVNGAKRKKHRK